MLFLNYEMSPWKEYALPDITEKNVGVIDPIDDFPVLLRSDIVSRIQREET